MSTGFECYFAEVTPGEWFYVLQNWDCPVGAWDWREYATAYGPFTSIEGARTHLRDNHANPGGYSTHEYEPGKELDEVEQKLFADAREKTLRRAAWR
ncbi:MAG TPA: hypothetical protein VLA89_02845 [Gemmatimonadales bacterium]|nr:hypothetical protein [Gemmatimonadales bacterium]